MYGQDIYGEKVTAIGCCRELCKIEGIQWIRILYCYPEEIDDESDPGDEGRAERSVIIWICQSSMQVMRS